MIPSCFSDKLGQWHICLRGKCFRCIPGVKILHDIFLMPLGAGTTSSCALLSFNTWPFNCTFVLNIFHQDEYSNRFFGDDNFHRFLYFIYTLGLYLLAAYCHMVNIDALAAAHHGRKLSAIGNENCELAPPEVSGFLMGHLITKISCVLVYVSFKIIINLRFWYEIQ